MLPYLKAIHIIFIVSWFAGLFYSVRLFIYHTEAEKKGEQERDILRGQFKLMEHRLWYIITVPSMILTIASGALMLALIPSYLGQGWMHLKLTFVAGLLIYHFACQKLLKELSKDIIKRSPKQLRVWNEIATVFLIAITFLVVLKDPVRWIWGALALIGFGLLLFALIKLIRKAK